MPTVCLRDCLLDVSRLFGLTLRPSAPVFRCHRETFDTLEAGTCAGSRAWYFSFVFPFVFLDGEVPGRILTACEEFLFRGFLTQGVLFFLCRTCFSHIALFSVLAMCIFIRSSIMYSGYACTRSNMITSWCLDRHPIASRSLARCCTHLRFCLTALRTTSAYFMNCETLCGDTSGMRAILANIFSC